MGKGSITALLGGIILIESASLPDTYTVYKDYGIKMSTCSIIAILVTLPISSFLLSYLGEIWLDKAPLKIDISNPTLDALDIEK